MVRETEVSFAPSNIKRVLKLRKDPLPNAPSYHERKANKDFRLDHILYDMCKEGAEWVCHRDGRPHYLRRSNLEPMTKGWYEFVCRSILPTSNHSELTVERAMLFTPSSLERISMSRSLLLSRFTSSFTKRTSHLASHSQVSLQPFVRIQGYLLFRMTH
ncbi:hypothetical protein PIB30_077225 [Stylosanthes scabra]|uniref:Putative plant transposon protein domain-containing protein n=1 Tax=Stylosanthes scabra TaxID=79078 RepID=A0ABU6VRQ0_9FABA|nr:hypothetical protein [Stylosanthes scabra]